MECPACGRRLNQVTIDEVVIDACKGGCGGIWFDNRELSAFVQPASSIGEELLKIPRDPQLEIDHSKPRICPLCGDATMIKQKSDINEKVVIDECPICQGIWLDAGELAAIREAASKPENKQTPFRTFLGRFLPGGAR